MLFIQRAAIPVLHILSLRPALVNESRLKHRSILQTRSMKRKAESDMNSSTRKSIKVGDYCSVETKRDENGNIIWPAPQSQMKAAQSFLREWYEFLVQNVSS